MANFIFDKKESAGDGAEPVTVSASRGWGESKIQPKAVRLRYPAPYGNQIQNSHIFLCKFNFFRVQATILIDF